jgi:predicted NAD/FAD-binding protein
MAQRKSKAKVQEQAQAEAMPGVKHVAIVGAGIGGMAAAYYLHGRRSADGRTEFRCAVFDRSERVGGNGLTAYFEKPFQPPFADLAVNDFNLTTYTLMADLLRQLAAQGFPVQHGALNDSACFFTAPGDRLQPPRTFTSEELDAIQAGKVPQPDPVLARIVADRTRFQGMVGEVMKKPEYAAMSVGEFLDGGPRRPAFSAEFRDLYVLPRINGMYFMGETTPQDMPIRGVMSYYLLQEGWGTPGKPDRRFFTNGCSDWFRQLRRALEARGVDFYLGEQPVVIAREARAPHVQSSKTTRVEWDHVIMAVPADEVPNVVVVGLEPMISVLLAKFRYINSVAVAHTSPDVMPAGREQWRTYNILIRPPRARMLRPYTISYVENMHQGAPRVPERYWLVSEDPHTPIPDDAVLQMKDPVTGKPVPAVAYFRHNTVTPETMGAQQMLSRLQGQNGIYYTGGWTNGAGLHEEILAISIEIAQRLRGYIDRKFQPRRGKLLAAAPAHVTLHTYNPDDPSYVPKYIRDALSDEPADAAPPGFWD